VAVVANDGQNKIDFFVWGLIPSWAKDPAIGAKMINARAETLAEKPSFKTAYKRRRCLVLTDGFFEWRVAHPSKGGSRGGVKTPMYIQLKSQEPFAFAGLWESWRSGEGDHILSCAIITTQPNELMAPIHNRMPVILPRQAYSQWLDPAEQSAGQLQHLLVPYPAEEMTAYPVSKLVNSPKNDLPDCIQPIEP
jgi:putative SOS response-associated peptidase YedK